MQRQIIVYVFPFVQHWHPYYLLTSLLTPWSRVLLEKLTGLQLVKKFPAFYGTQRFITALTSARHLSLSWASSIQSTHPHPTSRRSFLILSSHLRLGLPSGLHPYLKLNFVENVNRVCRQCLYGYIFRQNPAILCKQQSTLNATDCLFR
jgi:hypothetical protein